MEPTTDPVMTILTTGGGGIGGGALTAYILTRLTSKNGNGSSDTAAAAMHEVANKLDHTNELLNELLRSHARLEGLMQSQRS